MSRRSRYAHVERERRFLLPAPIGDVVPVPEGRVLEIDDR